MKYQKKQHPHEVKEKEVKAVVIRPEHEVAATLELECTNEERIKVHAIPVTLRHHQAPLACPLTIEVRSGDGTFSQREIDGTALPPGDFYVVSGDAFDEDTTYLVTGDSDLGQGVKTMSSTVILHVTHPEGVGLVLAGEPPVMKP